MANETRISPARDQRLYRMRELISEDLAEGLLRNRSAYAAAIVEEFDVSPRTALHDYDTVWRHLRATRDADLIRAQREILARLDDYVHELADLYAECRADPDRPGALAAALATLKEMAKARDLLTPEKIEVTVKPAFDVGRLSLDERRAMLDGIRKARSGDDRPS